MLGSSFFLCAVLSLRRCTRRAACSEFFSAAREREESSICRPSNVRALHQDDAKRVRRARRAAVRVTDLGGEGDPRTDCLLRRVSPLGRLGLAGLTLTAAVCAVSGWAGLL